LKIKTILVSQPQPSDVEKPPYADLAKKFNVSVVFRKFIKIEGIPAKEFRKDRVNILDYTAVIFTSRNAVDHFFRISESTAYYLQKYVQYRKRKVFHSKESFANLVELAKKHKAEKFLLPCSDIHKQEVANMLEENKIIFKKAVIYRTLASDLSDLKIEDFDLVVFFSPAGIKSLLKNFPKYKQNKSVIGAFGASTVKSVTEAGLTLGFSAPSKTAPSMTMAIEQYLQNELKKK
jgi:uroporphyrinogen-III synthase